MIAETIRRLKESGDEDIAATLFLALGLFEDRYGADLATDSAILSKSADILYN